MSWIIQGGKITQNTFILLILLSVHKSNSFLLASCFFIMHAANSFCFTDKETDNQNSPTCQENAQITEIFPLFKKKIIYIKSV